MGIFNKICQDYGFVSGLQTLSFGWCSAGLFDHIFIFKTKEGQKYAVVNPYLKPEEIAIILDGMGLADQSTILGPGFWNAGTTAVLLPFEPVMDIVKYRYFKSMGEEKYECCLDKIYSRLRDSHSSLNLPSQDNQ